MNLKRNGYTEKRHLTGFDISDKSEKKIKKILDLMKVEGYKCCWNECDGVEILSFIVDTSEIDDFKETYKKSKSAI